MVLDICYVNVWLFVYSNFTICLTRLPSHPVKNKNTKYQYGSKCQVTTNKCLFGHIRLLEKLRKLISANTLNSHNHSLHKANLSDHFTHSSSFPVSLKRINSQIASSLSLYYVLPFSGHSALQARSFPTIQQTTNYQTGNVNRPNNNNLTGHTSHT